MAINGGKPFSQQEPTLLTCKAIDAPGNLSDPWCGLPAAPESLRIAGQALCSDHLKDYISGEIGTNGS